MDNISKRKAIEKAFQKNSRKIKGRIAAKMIKDANAEALSRTTPSIVLQGFQTCYIKLYDDFLKPIEEEVVTDKKEQQKLINDLIMHIAKERKLALEYMGKHKTNNIKEEEVKENE